jgi:pimeloyl-ACP methyl ester carboxylesterase
MDMTVLRTPDGQTLHAYSAGSRDRPPLILVIPVAIPVGMMAEAIRELSKEFFVVTWEARCCLTRDPFDADTRVDVDVQANDLLLVITHFGLSGVHVVGWCTGAIYTLQAAYRHPETIGSMTLAMGTYGFTEADGIVLSPYQIEIIQFMPRVAADRRAAFALQKLVFNNPAFMETMSNEWSRWTRVAFTDPEILYRFANSAIRILDADVNTFAPEVHTPTLVITSKGDRYAHPEHSRCVARLLPNVTLFEDDEGDHYSIAVPSSATFREAAAFIRRQQGVLSRVRGSA